MSQSPLASLSEPTPSPVLERPRLEWRMMQAKNGRSKRFDIIMPDRRNTVAATIRVGTNPITLEAMQDMLRTVMK